MNRCDGRSARTGLEFFGTISASISHELKNALAIINESAGLIEDFTLMARKGIPLEPERLVSVAGRIQKQVARADGIVKNMNRFAHSVDEPLKEVDLGDTVQFIGTLSQRLAARLAVTLPPVETEGALMIFTDPFSLQNLVWRCLYFAMSVAGAEKRIGTRVDEKTEKLQIRFDGLKGLSTWVPADFPGEAEKGLLETLGAELILETGAGDLVLLLPKRIPT